MTKHQLIMPSAQAHQIIRGEKTMHLHPARYDDNFRLRPCPYRPSRNPTEPDQRVPILDPSRTKNADEIICWVEVVDAPFVITLRQAVAEKPNLSALGYRSLYDLQREWIERHDREAPADAVGIVARFTARWEPSPVWVLRLRAVPAPRFLSSRPPSANRDSDYVTDPRQGMRGEAEAVPVEFQEKETAKARQRDEERRKERGEGRDMRSRRFFDRKRVA